MSSSLKSSDYIWLIMFFAILFSDIGSIKLTKNEQNNIAMLMANTDILRGEEDKMSSISATQYGQIIEEVEKHVDQDTEQTENN